MKIGFPGILFIVLLVLAITDYISFWWLLLPAGIVLGVLGFFALLAIFVKLNQR